jgi:hypothetical protein
MRHFFISEAIAAGIPSYEVARLAGMSVIQIEATYAHLFGEHLEPSRTALEAFDEKSERKEGCNEVPVDCPEPGYLRYGSGGHSRGGGSCPRGGVTASLCPWVV